MSFFSLYFLF